MRNEGNCVALPELEEAHLCTSSLLSAPKTEAVRPFSVLFYECHTEVALVQLIPAVRDNVRDPQSGTVEGSARPRLRMLVL